jgi:hypothetical protein
MDSFTITHTDTYVYIQGCMCAYSTIDVPFSAQRKSRKRAQSGLMVCGIFTSDNIYWYLFCLFKKLLHSLPPNTKIKSARKSINNWQNPSGLPVWSPLHNFLLPHRGHLGNPVGTGIHESPGVGTQLASLPVSYSPSVMLKAHKWTCSGLVRISSRVVMAFPTCTLRSWSGMVRRGWQPPLPTPSARHLVSLRHLVTDLGDTGIITCYHVTVATCTHDHGYPCVGTTVLTSVLSRRGPADT